MLLELFNLHLIKINYDKTQNNKQQLSVLILHNQGLSNSWPRPPLWWLRNMWTEILPFEAKNATKNVKYILDFGTYKGSLVGYD